jgi:hypothetical protein
MPGASAAKHAAPQGHTRAPLHVPPLAQSWSLKQPLSGFALQLPLAQWPLSPQSWSELQQPALAGTQTPGSSRRVQSAVQPHTNAPEQMRFGPHSSSRQQPSAMLVLHSDLAQITGAHRSEQELGLQSASVMQQLGKAGCSVTTQCSFTQLAL